MDSGAEGGGRVVSGASPFRFWVWDDCFPVIDSVADFPPCPGPAWEACYANDVERGKAAARDLAHFPGWVRGVFAALRSQSSCGAWSRRLGYRVEDDPELWGGGVHRSAPPAWLQVHLDYARSPRHPGRRRALNLIAFLNPEWRAAWGGALLLCDPSGAARVKVYPAPGRVAAFECSDVSYHGVEGLAADAPPRLTAAVYLLAEATPADTRTRAMFVPNRRGGRCPAEVARGVAADAVVTP